MPLNAPRIEFNMLHVSNAPEDEGVYVLWDGEEIIYIGRAVGRITLRRCLSDHCSGYFGYCTQNATHFGWEVARFPIAREAELLDEFRARFNALPRCHEERRRMPR
jgi:hypothetical protein